MGAFSASAVGARQKPMRRSHSFLSVFAMRRKVLRTMALKAKPMNVGAITSGNGGSIWGDLQLLMAAASIFLCFTA